jgi:hypothetical protein
MMFCYDVLDCLNYGFNATSTTTFLDGQKNKAKKLNDNKVDLTLNVPYAALIHQSESPTKDEECQVARPDPDDFRDRSPSLFFPHKHFFFCISIGKAIDNREHIPGTLPDSHNSHNEPPEKQGRVKKVEVKFIKYLNSYLLSS